jgi:hypothetical protein
MLDRVGEGVTDVTASGSLPMWALAVVAAFAAVAYILASVRNHADRGSLPVAQVAVVLMLVLAGWWALDEFNRRDLAAERRALEARAFELSSRALMPGSALSCLDPLASDRLDEPCERALFATPEATAAAVSYVGAQLSLLAAASEHVRRGGPSYGSALTTVRRSVEADRFGIVAHVLAVRDGCTPEQCAAFAFLQGTARVVANLAERPFETSLKTRMANWPAAVAAPGASAPVANATPAAPPPTVAAARTPNNLYFPSSSSIPPVNIMTAEPPPLATTGGGEAVGGRKPSREPSRDQPAAAPSRQPPSAAAVPTPSPRTGPMQLSPGAQQ